MTSILEILEYVMRVVVFALIPPLLIAATFMIFKCMYELYKFDKDDIFNDSNKRKKR